MGIGVEVLLDVSICHQQQQKYVSAELKYVTLPDPTIKLGVYVAFVHEPLKFCACVVAPDRIISPTKTSIVL
jgi:hypothetical protein